MALPKIVLFLAWLLWKLLIIALTIPAMAAYLVFIVFTLPYTRLHASSNWSLRPRDSPVVELYLRHFEHLHPDLMSYVAAAHKESTQSEPPGIDFWPHRVKRSCIYFFIGSRSTTTWKFSQSAGLFGRLEYAGWGRRLLWTFLRDQVEQAGLATPAERDAFARVMEKMNSHRLLGKASNLGEKVFSWSDHLGDVKAQQQQLVAFTDRYGGRGFPIEHIRKDSLDWLLRRGALLVPDRETRPMLRAMAGFTPAWGSITAESDLEKGLPDCWQTLDIRHVYPWHGI